MKKCSFHDSLFDVYGLRKYPMIIIIALLMIFLSIPLYAANVYVGPSSTGDGSGNSWTNTKAISTLSGTGWVRGNTYYLKEGSYGSVSFATANSGSTYIYVKKCGAAGQTAYGSGDGTCETASGFVASQHDAQATFTEMSIRTGYWDISGVTGGGPGTSGAIRTNFTSGHGFKIVGYSYPLIDLNYIGADYLYLRHIEADGIDRMAGLGTSDCASGGIKSVMNTPNGVYFSPGAGITNSTFEYMYIHDIVCPAFHTFGMDGVTIQYSAVLRNGRSGTEPVPHSEVWSGLGDNNVTFRWNWLEDSSNTAVLAHVNGGSTSGCKVYGNVVRQTGLSGVHASNFLDIAGADSSSNWKVYNNTLVGWTSGGPKITFASGSGNEVYNNIWAHHPATDPFMCAGAHDYNSFYSMIYWVDGSTNFAPGAASAEAHGQLFTSTPFTSYATGDFSLKNATAAGVTLPSPYNVDMFGCIRGADGIWDRGAFEFGCTTPPPPPPPEEVPSAPSGFRLVN